MKIKVGVMAMAVCIASLTGCSNIDLQEKSNIKEVIATEESPVVAQKTKLEEAKELIKKGEMRGPINILDKISEGDKDYDEAQKLLLQTKQAYDKYIIEERLPAEGYEEGKLGLWQDLLAYEPLDQRLIDLKAGKGELAKQAKNMLKDKKIKQEKQMTENLTKNMDMTALDRIDVVYDDMEQETIIIPKSFDSMYNNIDENTNVAPKIVDGSLYVVLGFVKETWVFTEKIIIKTDSNNYEIPVDYFDFSKQVLDGGIAEYYGISGYGNENMLNDISNSKEVKIRFSGEDGFFEKAISTKEKGYLKDLIQITNNYDYLDFEKQVK